MKKPLAILCLGMALGMGLTFLLGRDEAPPASSQVDFLEYYLDMDREVLSMTHGLANGMGRVPETIGSLEDSAISNMMGISTRIRGADGELAGLASELEVFPDDKGLRPGVSWKTTWTLSTPQGVLVAYQIEQPPIAHLPAIASVAAGIDWSGSISADTSSGPHPSGRGIIIGGTGAFAGATGTFVEKVDLRGMTTDGELSGTVYLQFYLDKSPDDA